MGIVKVAAFAVSMDGYGAGIQQSLSNPLGVRGTELHHWMYKTRMFQKMTGGNAAGTTDIDNDFAEKSMQNAGAWIMGRNMFSPLRGPWLDDRWKGWWKDDPPYHTPVFVLTHHARGPLPMKGGTTFYFVTEGIEAALRKAREAAGTKDVRIGGGVSVVRQYLKARLIDEIHWVLSPVFLGAGENLFSGLDMPALGYHPVEHTASASALHVIIKKEK